MVEVLDDLDMFIVVKEQSSLEVDIPTPIKVMDPFLRFRKKVGRVAIR